ncbi:MAG: GNAT family N-acetyltransferase [Chloroflexota bacterium]|jgi:CelD/BcsL family acetyltransferase involved in cellulose biosynthesis
MELQLVDQWNPALCEEWNRLVSASSAQFPFSRFEFMDIWWRTRGGGEWQPESRLALVTARVGGQLRAIAPLFWTPDFAGQPALMLLGSIEISDYLDLIACPQDLNAFCVALLPFLRDANLPGWRALELFNLPDDSRSLPALQAAAHQHGWDFGSQPYQRCPYIPLPGDWETYLAGIDKKQRHEIRRKMRRAESLNPPAHWRRVEERATLDADIDAFFALMEQDEEKRRFLTAPMRAAMREIITCAFDQGCLNLAFLEVDSQQAAAYLSFDYLNRLWVYNSGYDRRFNDYSPGWVLLGYLLEWANQRGYREFDFMRGDEDYKYRFGAVDRRVLRVTLTPRRTPPP